MKRAFRSTIALLAAVAAALAATAGASAAGGAGAATPLLPPAGSVLTGVSAGPPAPFAAEVGKHPAVYGEFVTWGQSIHFAFNDAAAAHALLMLHISTSMGFGAKQRITPLGIAQGHGDRYLLFLSGLIRQYGKPVYVRLFPEMDNANNAYSAFDLERLLARRELLDAGVHRGVAAHRDRAARRQRRRDRRAAARARPAARCTGSRRVRRSRRRRCRSSGARWSAASPTSPATAPADY